MGQNTVKIYRLLILALLTLIFATGCTTDCIYKLAEDSSGDELCFRFCPMEDDEGNVVMDADDFVVYERKEVVSPLNCSGIELINIPSTTTTSSTS